MVLVSVPPRFPEQARAIQRQFSPAMITAEEMSAMRQRHPGGEGQIERLFTWCRRLADNEGDVNFTPDLLGTISAETLVVFGDRDPLYPVSLGVELRECIPHSHLWVLPNAGHGPIFGDAAEQFAAVALPFLRGRWT
jgi:pimeloyl-ACP methyl ester carboxylesterase